MFLSIFQKNIKIKKGKFCFFTNNRKFSKITVFLPCLFHYSATLVFKFYKHYLYIHNRYWCELAFRVANPDYKVSLPHKHKEL